MMVGRRSCCGVFAQINLCCWQEKDLDVEFCSNFFLVVGGDLAVEHLL